MSINFIVFDWIQSGITVLEQIQLQMLKGKEKPPGTYATEYHFRAALEKRIDPRE
jgi:hypothetical protein